MSYTLTFPVKSHTQNGFTIVELLIVIVVIAILAAITTATFSGVSARAQEVSANSDLRNNLSTAMQYKVVHNEFPAYMTSDSGCVPSDSYGGTQCLVSSDPKAVFFSKYELGVDGETLKISTYRGRYAYHINQDGVFTKEECANSEEASAVYTCPSGFSWKG